MRRRPVSSGRIVYGTWPTRPPVDDGGSRNFATVRLGCTPSQHSWHDWDRCGGEVETMTSQLEQEVADLCTAADRYDARHRRIADLTWPAGARIAVNFTADFDAMLLRRLMNEPPMQLAKGEFGGRVGIWRLIELFDSHQIKATIFTPGRICALYPDAVKAAARSGHEIADHMWEHRVPKEAAVERAHLSRATGAIERLVGQRPIGTRSWHAPELLTEFGYF